MQTHDKIYDRLKTTWFQVSQVDKQILATINTTTGKDRLDRVNDLFVKRDRLDDLARTLEWVMEMKRDE